MIPVLRWKGEDHRLKSILDRPAAIDAAVHETASQILAAVRAEGDAALLRFTHRFDSTRVEKLRVEPSAIAEASDKLDEDVAASLTIASDNIRRFHERQVERSWTVDDGDGVVLGQRVLPIQRAGLYVPGGKAFYPSSLLMNAIPAQVAGVPGIAVVSPPGNDGLPSQLVLATAGLLGLDEIYAAGGAQAIAALAYGTESVPAVDKIVGPGNAYVAAAKQQVFGTVDIDSVSGPSEIVVLADDSANATYVAADLLAQAEHDERASAILVTDNGGLAEAVQKQISDWWGQLDRQEILAASLANHSACILVDSIAEAAEVVNAIAPEHLEIMTVKPWSVVEMITHAGAIFVGPYSPEPVGDYIAGPNHVLPTSGTARFASALGVHDFTRRQSVIGYSEPRLRETAPHIMRLAEAEQLTAHARSIRVRVQATAEIER